MKFSDEKELFERIGREMGKPCGELTAADLLEWRAIETARFDQLEQAYREGKESGRWARFDELVGLDTEA